MDRTVYFADKSVTFADRVPAGPHHLIRLGVNERVSRAKILKILEIYNFITVVSSEPDAVYEAFAGEFISVAAAGGIVVNGRGEWLMIHRNGRWDLPKGHLEAFETLEQCAVREVHEETGVKCRGVVRLLCDTLHAYDLYGRWELKCTRWYELRCEGVDAPTAPQTEEGIDTAAWCSPERVARNLETTYPTIRKVIACL